MKAPLKCATTLGLGKVKKVRMTIYIISADISSDIEGKHDQAVETAQLRTVL